MVLLSHLIISAYNIRKNFFQRMEKQNTTCYRIFHGIAEGRPGLTIDRYGSVLLAQTFGVALSKEELFEVENILQEFYDKKSYCFVYNHRGNESLKQGFEAWHKPNAFALEPQIIYESGIKYISMVRHRGQDPLLFLDLRVARNYVREHSKNCSILNLFAYTCGVGVCAMVGGAKEVWNIDFSSSSLEYGKKNKQLNGNWEQFHIVQTDVFCALYQFANRPLKGRGAKQHPPKIKLKEHNFDLVFLDPPAWAKSPYGTVDLIRDYQSLLKPCLWVTKPGGTIIAVNNVAQVSIDEWVTKIERCSQKAGRLFQKITILKPEEDFPSWDNNPPLKIAVCQLQ